MGDYLKYYDCNTKKNRPVAANKDITLWGYYRRSFSGEANSADSLVAFERLKLSSNWQTLQRIAQPLQYPCAGFLAGPFSSCLIL